MVSPDIPANRVGRPVRILNHAAGPTHLNNNNILNSNQNLNNEYNELVALNNRTNVGVDEPPRRNFSFGDSLSQGFIGSRLIPKIGSIVRRFSLNYAGEGLVTDREHSRVLRVGIRFQVEVNSYPNRGQRGLPRSSSLPAVDIVEVGEGADERNSVVPVGTGHHITNRTISTNSDETYDHSARRHSHHFEPLSYDRRTNSSGNSYSGSCSTASSTRSSQSDILSSQCSSPLTSHSGVITPSAFHSRINQALTQDYNQFHSSASGDTSASSVTSKSFPSGGNNSFRGSKYNSRMEDSSSYQVLHYFPGQRMNSLTLPPYVESMLTTLKANLKENPVMSMMVVALCFTCALPVLAFAGFALLTLIVTFSGFVFVEGTVLTIATIILGTVLLICGLVAAVGVGVGAGAYFCASLILRFWSSDPNQNEALLDLSFLKRWFSSLKRKFVGQSKVDENSHVVSNNGVNEDKDAKKKSHEVYSNGVIKNGMKKTNSPVDEKPTPISSGEEKEENGDVEVLREKTVSKESGNDLTADAIVEETPEQVKQEAAEEESRNEKLD